MCLRNWKNLKSKNSEPQSAEQGYHYSLRLLTGRDYTIARLRKKLAARDVTGQDVEAIIVRLQEEGWLDDRRYAGRFAESALADGRFYGPRLRLEMRRRGFSADLVAEIIKKVSEDYDEGAELSMIIKDQFPFFVFSTASDKEKRKVINWLQRRGFRMSLIVDRLRKAEDGTP
jgi:regulatory protein